MTRRPMTVAALAVSALLFAPGAALAVPSEGVGAVAGAHDSEATRDARAELVELDRDAERVAERYNAGRDELLGLQAELEAAQEASVTAAARVDKAQSVLGQYAGAIYRTGPTEATLPVMMLVNGRSSAETLDTMTKLTHVGQRQVNTLDELRQARSEVRSAQEQKEEATARSAELLESVAADKARLDGELTDKRDALVALVAADEARYAAEQERLERERVAREQLGRERAAAAAAEAASVGAAANAPVTREVAAAPSFRGGGPGASGGARALEAFVIESGAGSAADFEGLSDVEVISRASSLILRSADAGSSGSTLEVLPGGRLRGEVAVDAALAELGKPYVWAGAGPNSFDCSGLTQWAWGKAGVGLTHYTGTQYSQNTKVSMGSLLPGDLVFSGSPIHHVSLYLGAGYVVHAPHSGDVVKVSRVSDVGFASASRP